MSGVHLVPGLWSIDVYDGISRMITDTFDVVPGETYIEFPYDWRRDNRVAARRLQRLVDEKLHAQRQRNPDAKVILIGHSMGGLVARYFLECLGGRADTRMLITFGTPHRGSLNAVDFLVNGFVKKLGPLKVADLSRLLRSLTSVYQLLPIYPCVDVGRRQRARRRGRPAGRRSGPGRGGAARLPPGHRGRRRGPRARRLRHPLGGRHHPGHEAVGAPRRRPAGGRRVRTTARTWAATAPCRGCRRRRSRPTTCSRPTSRCTPPRSTARCSSPRPCRRSCAGSSRPARSTAFRAVQGVRVEADELLATGESLPVRALPDAAGLTLRATVTDVATGRVAGSIVLRRDGDDVHTGELPPLPAATTGCGSRASAARRRWPTRCTRWCASSTTSEPATVTRDDPRPARRASTPTSRRSTRCSGAATTWPRCATYLEARAGAELRRAAAGGRGGDARRRRRRVPRPPRAGRPRRRRPVRLLRPRQRGAGAAPRSPRWSRRAGSRRSCSTTAAGASTAGCGGRSPTRSSPCCIAEVAAGGAARRDDPRLLPRRRRDPRPVRPAARLAAAARRGDAGRPRRRGRARRGLARRASSCPARSSSGRRRARRTSRSPPAAPTSWPRSTASATSTRGAFSVALVESLDVARHAHDVPLAAGDRAGARRAHGAGAATGAVPARRRRARPTPCSSTARSCRWRRRSPSPTAPTGGRSTAGSSTASATRSATRRSCSPCTDDAGGPAGTVRVTRRRGRAVAGRAGRLGAGGRAPTGPSSSACRCRRPRSSSTRRTDGGPPAADVGGRARRGARRGGDGRARRRRRRRRCASSTRRRRRPGALRLRVAVPAPGRRGSRGPTAARSSATSPTRPAPAPASSSAASSTSPRGSSCGRSATTRRRSPSRDARRVRRPSRRARAGRPTAPPLPADGSCVLDVRARGRRLAGAAVFIELRSHVEHDLYVAVLDLTDRFRCHPVVPTVKLGAGRTFAARRRRPIPASLPPDEVPVVAAPSVRDWLKVIVSDVDFDASSFTMQRLDQPPPRHAVGRRRFRSTLDRLAARAISRDVGAAATRRARRRQWAASTLLLEVRVPSTGDRAGAVTRQCSQYPCGWHRAEVVDRRGDRPASARARGRSAVSVPSAHRELGHEDRALGEHPREVALAGRTRRARRGRRAARRPTGS